MIREDRAPRRPIHARGFRIGYATMPRWLCRIIALVATTILVLALLVGDRVIAARVSRPHDHGELESFVIAIAVLVFVIWKSARVAVRTGRLGWSKGAGHQSSEGDA